MKVFEKRQELTARKDDPHCDAAKVGNLIMSDRSIIPSLFRVGTSRDSLCGKIFPGESATNPTRVLLDSPRGAARFLLAQELSGEHYDRYAKMSFNRLRTAMELPWTVGGDDVVRFLVAAGLELMLDDNEQIKAEAYAKRALARYPRTVQTESENWEYLPGDIDPTLVATNEKVLRNLGWRKNGMLDTTATDSDATRENGIFSFFFDDICMAATKRDVIIGHFVGSGKTRAALALAEIHRAKGATGPVIILAPRQHLSDVKAWMNEIASAYPLRERYGNDCMSVWFDKKDRPDLTKPFLLLSLDRLKRLEEPEWATLLQAAKKSMVIIDEAHSLKESTSAQSEAARRLLWSQEITGRIALSGTLLKSNPSDAWNLFSLTFLPGSVMFPNYRADRQGGKIEFENTYSTFAISGDGKRKKTPILKTPEKFFKMTRHLVCRRLRNEPDVVKVLGSTQIEINHIDVEFTREHRAFYDVLMKQFKEWWAWYVEQKIQLTKEKLRLELDLAQEKGNTIAIGNLQNQLSIVNKKKNKLEQLVLVKIGYMIRGSIQPWAMKQPDENEIDEKPFKFPPFGRGPTALHNWAVEKALEVVITGKQVIVAGFHTEQLTMISEIFEAQGIKVAQVHGEAGKTRDKEIARFRSGKCPILVGSYGMMSTGLNLGEAETVIPLEPTWEPSTIDQLEGRITRGFVETLPISYRLNLVDSMTQYMWKWCELKKKALQAGLDRKEQNVSGADILDIQTFLEAEMMPRKYFLESA
jgi:SNF2-related domain/Helicase conserved C-terminal domain